MTAETQGRAGGLSHPVTPEPVPTTRVDKRRYDIELMRIIASISVVVLHTSGLLFAADIRKPGEGASHWIALTGDTLGRFAVPAFFAISGWAVLVASPPRDSSILMRRVVRVLVPLGAWTAIYLLWSTLLTDKDDRPSVRLAAEALAGSIRPAFHLWYLYSYIPLLILLGCAYLVMSGKSLRLAGIVLLVFAVLPTFAAPVAVLTGWELPKTQWGPAFYQVIFAVGGAGLLSRPHPIKRPLLIPCAAVAFVAVMWWEHAVQYPSPYGTLAVAVYTAAALLLIMTIRVPERARPLVRTLADASFGVYLVHLLLLQAALAWMIRPNPGDSVAAGALIAVSGAVAVAAFGLSLLWGKLGLRKLLG